MNELEQAQQLQRRTQHLFASQSARRRSASIMKSGGNREVPTIKVRNLQRTVPLDAAELERFAARSLRLCLKIRHSKGTDLAKLRHISVLVVSDRRMASLHRQFLNEPGPTDVMTFQHGEIFIGAETARLQARQFGNSLAQELGLYVVHGLLHLHGFDDRTEAEGRKIKATQRRIFARAGGLN
jgi:probable rRNA maturation factor